jgi:hypothetical protein
MTMGMQAKLGLNIGGLWFEGVTSLLGVDPQRWHGKSWAHTLTVTMQHTSVIFMRMYRDYPLCNYGLMDNGTYFGCSNWLECVESLKFNEDLTCTKNCQSTFSLKLYYPLQFLFMYTRYIHCIQTCSYFHSLDGSISTTQSSCFCSRPSYCSVWHPSGPRQIQLFRVHRPTRHFDGA